MARRKTARNTKKAKAPSAQPQRGERVLALDVSSKCVGWSVFDGGERVQHGRYHQQGKEGRHGEKLHRFYHWVRHALEVLQPDQLIYEAPYQGRMRNTFGILSRYVGVVEAAAFGHFQKELPPENAVPARMVKKAIGAKKGRNHEQNKKIVLQLVNQRYGLGLKFKSNDANKRVSQDDEADAIALNWAWHELYRGAE